MMIEKWLKLAKKRIDTLDAELILLAGLGEALPQGADRSYLVAHAEAGISQEKWQNLEPMLARRERGEPLAYILGMREFYGRDFAVNPAVLIPRPETEALVEIALELIGDARGGSEAKAGSEEGFAIKVPKTAEKRRILEIGTGSGCIATTLALELAAEGKEVDVIATDISGAALEVAEANAVKWGAKVEFRRGDLLRKCPQSDDSEQDWLFPKGTKFDLLVANLPYVDQGWEWLDRRSLDFEPSLALYAQEGGLALYRELLAQIGATGITTEVVIEVDLCQQKKMAEMAQEYGFSLRKVRGFGIWLAGKSVEKRPGR